MSNKIESTVTSPQPPPPATIGDDLLWGAEAIAAELAVSVVRVYYFCP
jgi:hypothetical protein